jgi:hypothetical protein
LDYEVSLMFWEFGDKASDIADSEGLASTGILLSDGDDLVDGGEGEMLDGAAGPADL